jgi:hypothetical protein
MEEDGTTDSLSLWERVRVRAWGAFPSPSLGLVRLWRKRLARRGGVRVRVIFTPPSTKGVAAGRGIKRGGYSVPP